MQKVFTKHLYKYIQLIIECIYINEAFPFVLTMPRNIISPNILNPYCILVSQIDKLLL